MEQEAERQRLGQVRAEAERLATEPPQSERKEIKAGRRIAAAGSDGQKKLQGEIADAVVVGKEQQEKKSVVDAKSQAKEKKNPFDKAASTASPPTPSNGSTKKGKPFDKFASSTVVPPQQSSSKPPVPAKEKGNPFGFPSAPAATSSKLEPPAKTASPFGASASGPKAAKPIDRATPPAKESESSSDASAKTASPFGTTKPGKPAAKLEPPAKKGNPFGFPSASAAPPSKLDPPAKKGNLFDKATPPSKPLTSESMDKKGTAEPAAKLEPRAKTASPFGASTPGPKAGGNPFDKPKPATPAKEESPSDDGPAKTASPFGAAKPAAKLEPPAKKENPFNKFTPLDPPKSTASPPLQEQTGKQSKSFNPSAPKASAPSFEPQIGKANGSEASSKEESIADDKEVPKYRFEADRIKADQEAKRKELEQERIEAAMKPSSIEEPAKKGNGFDKVASIAAGAVGLGLLAVGGPAAIEAGKSAIDNMPTSSVPFSSVSNTINNPYVVPSTPAEEEAASAATKAEAALNDAASPDAAEVEASVVPTEVPTDQAILAKTKEREVEEAEEAIDAADRSVAGGAQQKADGEGAGGVAALEEASEIKLERGNVEDNDGKEMMEAEPSTGLSTLGSNDVEIPKYAVPAAAALTTTIGTLGAVTLLSGDGEEGGSEETLKPKNVTADAISGSLPVIDNMTNSSDAKGETSTTYASNAKTGTAEPSTLKPDMIPNGEKGKSDSPFFFSGAEKEDLPAPPFFAQTQVNATVEQKEGKEPSALEAEKRWLAEDRVDAVRKEAERVDAEEKAQEQRVEAERIERERIEAKRIAEAEAEKQRLEVERIKAERIAAEEEAKKIRLEAERIEAGRSSQAETSAKKSNPCASPSPTPKAFGKPKPSAKTASPFGTTASTKPPPKIEPPAKKGYPFGFPSASTTASPPPLKPPSSKGNPFDQVTPSSPSTQPPGTKKTNPFGFPSASTASPPPQKPPASQSNPFGQPPSKMSPPPIEPAKSKTNPFASKQETEKQRLEDERIAAELKAAKYRFEAERIKAEAKTKQKQLEQDRLDKTERIEVAKNAEKEFLEKERLEAKRIAAEKAKRDGKGIVDAEIETQPSKPSSGSSNQTSKRGDKNSRSPNAIPSGSSASSSWSQGQAKKKESQVKPMARQTGPRPVVSSTSSTPAKPVSPGAAMRGDMGSDRRSPGAVPFSSDRTSEIGDSWFQEQLLQAQREQEAGPTPLGGTRTLADGTKIEPSVDGRSFDYDVRSSAGSESVLDVAEYARSAFVGALVGTWAVFPVTAYHYLVFSDYTYTTFAQWEWELVAASVQSACFAILYRYALRNDIGDESLKRKLVLASVLLKSVVRVQVPYVCAAGEMAGGLYCADFAPLYVVNDSMMAEISMNFVEGMALFGVTALAMNWLVKKGIERERY